MLATDRTMQNDDIAKVSPELGQSRAKNPVWQPNSVTLSTIQLCPGKFKLSPFPAHQMSRTALSKLLQRHGLKGWRKPHDKMVPIALAHFLSCTCGSGPVVGIQASGAAAGAAVVSGQAPSSGPASRGGSGRPRGQRGSKTLAPAKVEPSFGLFGTLPVELVIQILDYLHWTALYRRRKVCKQFSFLVFHPELWHAFEWRRGAFGAGPDTTTLQTVEKIAELAVSLGIKGIRDSCLDSSWTRQDWDVEQQRNLKRPYAPKILLNILSQLLKLHGS